MTGKVVAGSYLVAENVERYRAIMRYCYRCHKAMNGLLYRQDIFDGVRNELGDTYTDSQLDQDLNQLVEWESLTRRQEMIRPKSIQEYKEKHYRYQISEKGILFEELLDKLNHLDEYTRGDLDKDTFVLLLENLEVLASSSAGTDQAKCWLRTIELFGKLQKNSSDYIGYINSATIDGKMKTESFLVYKDQFIMYLRDFIVKIQELYYKLTAAIDKLGQESISRSGNSVIEKSTGTKVDEIIQSVVAYEQSRSFLEAIDEETLRERCYDLYKGMYRWFNKDGKRDSEYDTLMNQTEQIISRITSLVYYYGQESRQYQSRRRDYLHIAQWFASADTVEVCGAMYGAIFGMTKVRHYYSPEEGSILMPTTRSWDATPAELFTGNLNRRNREERRVKTVAVNRQLQKEQRQEYLAKVQYREQVIERYFSDNYLLLKDGMKIEPMVRTTLLRWISRSIATGQDTVRTEFGYQLRVVVDTSQWITLVSEDGRLTMPQVCFYR